MPAKATKKTNHTPAAAEAKNTTQAAVTNKATIRPTITELENAGLKAIQDVPRVHAPKGTQLCRGLYIECDPLGYLCAGEHRVSCSGWVCKKHVAIGTKRPFKDIKICRICFTKQSGTRDKESSKESSK